MWPARLLLRAFGLLTGTLIVLALPASPVRAQTAAAPANLSDQLVPKEDTEIDVAALRQQAADRIKTKVDPQPQKRTAMAPQLNKLPQFRFEVVFDPDSSLVRPDSYGLLGRIADALADPKLQPYRYLIVDHVESAGRRDFNLTLSQRRADSIRDVLVGTFKISGKRLLALGLGEEQLQDTNRPSSPANARLQLIALGEIPPPEPAAAPVAVPKAPAKKDAAKKKKH